MTRLQYERRRRGFSQPTVAAVLGTHQPVISMIENGRLVPMPAQLQRLAKAFDIYPPEKLLEHVVVLREPR